MGLTGAAICALSLLSAALFAQAPPWIAQNGVVNSASRIPATLAGGAIARGALFTIYGVRLGASGHTQVTVSAGGKSANARVLSAGAERIDALMPPAAPLGAALLVVTVGAQASSPFSMEVVEANPGLFSRNGEGWGPGRIENLSAGGAKSENSTSHPARPGQRVAVYTTGMGNSRGVRVVVGGRPVRAVRTGNVQGEERIEFQIPAGVPEGCYVPVYLLVSPVRASNAVTMTIHSGPGPCTPDVVPLDAGRTAVAVLARIRMKARYADVDTIDDEAVAVAAKNDQPVLAPLLLLPPPGSCTAYTSSLQADTALPNSIPAALLVLLRGRGLDAGPQFNLTRAGESRAIRRDNNVAGYYHARLGQAGAGASRRAPPLFLDPGELTLTGSGGKDVGGFNVRVPAPVPFEWTDRDSLTVIDRRRPLVLHWRPIPAGRIMILATNVDQITTAMGMCLCVAEGGAGRFTVPPAVLANVPLSRDIPGVPFDQLFVSSLVTGPSFQAAGVNAGAVASLYTIGRFVEYR